MSLKVFLSLSESEKEMYRMAVNNFLLERGYAPQRRTFGFGKNKKMILQILSVKRGGDRNG